MTLPISNGKGRGGEGRGWRSGTMRDNGAIHSLGEQWVRSAKELHVYICQVGRWGPRCQEERRTLSVSSLYETFLLSPPSPPPPRARGPIVRRDRRCVFLLNASRVRLVKGSHGWANLLPMGTHGDSGSSPNTPVATRPSYGILHRCFIILSLFVVHPPRDDPFPSLVFFHPFFATAGPYGCFDWFHGFVESPSASEEKSLRWHYVTMTGILGVHYEGIQISSHNNFVA